jgi:hypothetical protein
MGNSKNLGDGHTFMRFSEFLINSIAWRCLDARCSILDKDEWIFTDELFLLNAVQVEDIAAETVSEPVRKLGYDIK